MELPSWSAARLVDVILALLAVTLTAPRQEIIAEETEGKERLYLFFQGREIYENNCLPCHGGSGKGDGPWAADWTKNRPRNFRSGVFKFGSTPMGYLPTDEDLERTILNGISGTAMPVFKGHLRDEELSAVISYIKSFSREWKKSDRHTEPAAVPKPPEWWRNADQKKERSVAGMKTFSNHCVVCHGEEGRGDGPGGAALKDIWGYEIKPADLSGAHYKSGDDPVDWFRTITLGLDGTPMVGFSGTLDNDEIWELIAFLDTLKEAKNR